jgi:phosphoglycolate phosphatase
MSETPRQIDDVVHDFDGTIADSGEANLSAMATVLGRDPFTLEEVEDMRSRTTRENMRQLGVRGWQLPRLLLKGQRIVGEKLDDIEVFEGMPDALAQLAEEGYGQYVLSTNSSENISRFLALNGLAGAVADVYGGVSMLGKARKLSRLVSTEGLVAERTVYVGDEGRDIEAAREAGMRCVAVAWGFQNAEALEAHEPDALVGSPPELVDAIHDLSFAGA